MTEIKKLSDCEIFPNLYYKVVENKTKAYQYCLKVGDYVRLVSNSDYCVGYRLSKDENEYTQLYLCMSELDWANKVFVEYDKDLVYKYLFENAKSNYEHYLNLAENCKKQMRECEEKLNESNCMDE